MAVLYAESAPITSARKNRNIYQAARELKGLTQEELSRRSKISKSIIVGLENGKITVTTTKTLVRIAEALECSISKFFL